MREKQVLVVDVGMQPVGVVPWQVAVSMWATEKASILEEYEDEVHSAYLTMRIPAVVRLTTPVVKRSKGVKFSRANVYSRDGYRCQYCGQKCTTDELTYDHVVPRSQGGHTVWANIVSCCVECNARKGGRTPEQAKMRLLKKPAQPTAVQKWQFDFPKGKIPEAWRDYVYWTGALDEVG